MNINLLKRVCQKLNKQQHEVRMVPPIGKKNVDCASDEHVTIQRSDYDNLVNFVELYTDMIEIEDVSDQFENSDFDSLDQFEQTNNLCNLGFFYVKVNGVCPVAEYLSLLSKIPFEQFCTPGTHQISFITLTELFGEESKNLIMRLMVLGDYFGYWELINPFQKMTSTNDNTKLLLSAMGSLSILIKPGFINSCVELVHNFDVISTKQTQSGQIMLY